MSLVKKKYIEQSRKRIKEKLKNIQDEAEIMTSYVNGVIERAQDGCNGLLTISNKSQFMEQFIPVMTKLEEYHNLLLLLNANIPEEGDDGRAETDSDDDENEDSEEEKISGTVQNALSVKAEDVKSKDTADTHKSSRSKGHSAELQEVEKVSKGLKGTSSEKTFKNEKTTKSKTLLGSTSHKDGGVQKTTEQVVEEVNDIGAAKCAPSVENASLSGQSDQQPHNLGPNPSLSGQPAFAGNPTGLPFDASNPLVLQLLMRNAGLTGGIVPQGLQFNLASALAQAGNVAGPQTTHEVPSSDSNDKQSDEKNVFKQPQLPLTEENVAKMAARNERKAESIKSSSAGHADGDSKVETYDASISGTGSSGVVGEHKKLRYPTRRRLMKRQKPGVVAASEKTAKENTNDGSSAAAMSDAISAGEPGQADLALMPEDYGDGPFIGAISLTEGKLTETLVIAVVSPWLFWVQPVSRKLQKLMSDLNQYEDLLKAGSPATKPPSKLKAGMVVCAQYSHDMHWYRALILSVQHIGHDKQMEVIYLDYGNREVLTSSQIRPLMQQYASLPCQAFPVGLSEVAPADGSCEWGHSTTAFLTSLAVSSVSVLVKKVDLCPVVVAEVFKQTSSSGQKRTDYFSFAQRLIENGLARRASNKRIVQYYSMLEQSESAKDPDKKMISALNEYELLVCACPQIKSEKEELIVNPNEGDTIASRLQHKAEKSGVSDSNPSVAHEDEELVDVDLDSVLDMELGKMPDLAQEEILSARGKTPPKTVPSVVRENEGKKETATKQDSKTSQPLSTTKLPKQTKKSKDVSLTVDISVTANKTQDSVRAKTDDQVFAKESDKPKIALKSDEPKNAGNSSESGTSKSVAEDQSKSKDQKSGQEVTEKPRRFEEPGKLCSKMSKSAGADKTKDTKVEKELKSASGSQEPAVGSKKARKRAREWAQKQAALQNQVSRKGAQQTKSSTQVDTTLTPGVGESEIASESTKVSRDAPQTSSPTRVNTTNASGMEESGIKNESSEVKEEDHSQDNSKMIKDTLKRVGELRKEEASDNAGSGSRGSSDVRSNSSTNGIVRDDKSSSASPPPSPDNQQLSWDDFLRSGVEGYPSIEVKAPKDGFLICLMSHIVSPSHFYVHLADQGCATAVDQLFQQVNQYFEEHKAVGLQKFFEPALYDRCVARFEQDNRLYRGTITQMGEGVLPTKFRVFFVDYGNQEWVHKDDIYPLPPKFCTIAPLAVPCMLPEVGPNEASAPAHSESGGWSSESIDQFQFLTGYTIPLQMHIILFHDEIIMVNEESPLGVKLVNVEGDEDVWIAQELVHGDFASPTDFYGISNLSINEYHLNDEVVQVDEKKLMLSEELEKWQPMTEDFDSIRNSYKVNIEDAGVAIMGYSAKDERRICRYFDMDMPCPRGEFCPYEHIKTAGVLTSDKVEVFAVNDEEQCLPGPDVDTWVAVEVTTVYNPSHFYASFPHGTRPIRSLVLDDNSLDGVSQDEGYPESADDETFESLRESMNEHYRRIRFRDIDMLRLANGEIVAAKFLPDNLWYRARILETDADNYRVKVFYLDFGNWEWLDERDTRQMQKRFMHLPFQALECHMAVLPARGEKWTADTIDAFHEIVDGEVFFAHIREGSGNTLLNVELWNSSEVNIGDLFVRKGHAKRPSTYERSGGPKDAESNKKYGAPPKQCGYRPG